jgi:hypothetical protein
MEITMPWLSKAFAIYSIYNRERKMAKVIFLGGSVCEQEIKIMFPEWKAMCSVKCSQVLNNIDLECEYAYYRAHFRKT